MRANAVVFQSRAAHSHVAGRAGGPASVTVGKSVGLGFRAVLLGLLARFLVVKVCARRRTMGFRLRARVCLAALFAAASLGSLTNTGSSFAPVGSF